MNLFLYIKKKTWQIYWSEQSFTGLQPEEQSFTGLQPEEQSFTGLRPEEQSFTGLQPEEQSFTGLQPEEQSFTGLRPEDWCSSWGLEVLEMKIWIYCSESNSRIYFYIFLNKHWKIYWAEQRFIGGHCDDCDYSSFPYYMTTIAA